jgi:hypothetical protein
MFLVLGGSSNRSEQHYRKYGTDSRLGRFGKSSDPKGTSSIGSIGFPHKDGIVVKTSYTVDRSQSADADEISLVEKNSPNSIEMDDVYNRNNSKSSVAEEMSPGGRVMAKVSHMDNIDSRNIRELIAAISIYQYIPHSELYKRMQ